MILPPRTAWRTSVICPTRWRVHASTSRAASASRRRSVSAWTGGRGTAGVVDPTPVLRGSQVEYFSSRTHGVEARAARAGHGVVAFLEVHRIPTQLIDLRTPVDRAVLVGAPIQDLD